MKYSLEELSHLPVITKLYYCNTEEQIYHLLEKDKNTSETVSALSCANKEMASLAEEIKGYLQSTEESFFLLPAQMAVIVGLYVITQANPALFKELLVFVQQPQINCSPLARRFASLLNNKITGTRPLSPIVSPTTLIEEKVICKPTVMRANNREKIPNTTSFKIFRGGESD